MGAVEILTVNLHPVDQFVPVVPPAKSSGIKPGSCVTFSTRYVPQCDEGPQP